ncbi:unnamed protein product [Amoebophrya sp. A120]|nr:unnamed protein product [Amoebophrya sp. A120]|eukprot:GSA120T00016347001.1
MATTSSPSRVLFSDARQIDVGRVQSSGASKKTSYPRRETDGRAAPRIRRSRRSAAASLLLLSASTTCHQSSLFAEAVDHSKFRTCEQGSFCRRYRKWVELVKNTPATFHWSIADTKEQSSSGGAALSPTEFDLHSTATSPSAVEAGTSSEDQAGASNSPPLTLKLDFYKFGGVRFFVTEKDPLYPRYKIPDGDVVVATERELVPMSDVSVSKIKDDATGAVAATVFEYSTSSAPGGGEAVAEETTKVKVELRHSPLLLIASANNVPFAVVNKRNLLNFEIYRPQNTVKKDKIYDAANHPTVDTHGLHAESFGSHHDPKPRGPASLGVDVTFVGDVGHVSGLPEHAAALLLKPFEEPYRLYNLDVFEYELNSPMALYGAVPMLWGYERSLHTVSGVLWNNPSETFVKVEGFADNTSWFGGGGSGDAARLSKGYDTWWVSESGVLDLFLFPGPHAPAVSKQFHSLTGFAPMPPVFAIGKHQCRWNYVSEKDLLEVHDKFESYDIPYDVLWLDIEHTDGKRYFTWDKRHFPNPDSMTKRLSGHGRKLVTIVDPHIKATGDYSVYTNLKDMDLLTKKKTWQYKDLAPALSPGEEEQLPMIKDPSVTGPPADWVTVKDGIWEHPMIPNPNYKPQETIRVLDYQNSPATNFEGWCWPGQSVYPDFSNPDMRKFWAARFNTELYTGSTLDTYTWNDMNEPSVFNGPEVSAPRDAVHVHDVEHRDNHNLYGMYVQRATFEGHLEHKQGRRPFVLSRSFFTGSHRYGAIWTGDNMAQWAHLKDSVAMVLSHALGGISFIGADVGGFFKNPEQELMVRWYQFGAIAYPFFRNHAHIETARREPWTLNKDNLSFVKAAVRLRYQLLPYYYTLFKDYTVTGKPVIQPLWYSFGKDPKVWEADKAEFQILVGDALMTRVVAEPNMVESTVYLPNETPDKVTTWYCWYTKEPLRGGGSYAFDVRGNAALVAKGGSVVPTKFRQRRSAALMKQDPFTLNVFLDPNTHTATGKVYVDDYVHVETPSVLQTITIEPKQTKNGAVVMSIYGKTEIAPASSTTQGTTTADSATILQGLENALAVTPEVDQAEKEHQNTAMKKNAGLLIERIVISGLGEQLAHNIKQVQRMITQPATAPGTDGQPAFENVQFRMDLTDTLLIKLPQVSVGQDWELLLTTEVDVAGKWEEFFI